ncbi:uncharacterized protein LOC135225074 [Macrobrachium nipponense]|uniref:uncharacterized protein LOC135225074 n=1 Tax=Macrobrachium nipponense TaxID=159736 RepID=UPI0030C7B0E5
MALRKNLVVIGIMFLFPVAFAEDSEHYLRLMDNFDQMISQLQEDNEIHKRELNDLIDKNTQLLRDLIAEHLSPLTDLSSEIVSQLRGSNYEEQEESEVMTCPLQRAMLSLLRDNPNNVTEGEALESVVHHNRLVLFFFFLQSLTHRLSSEFESVAEPACPEPEPEPTPEPGPPSGENCLAVPVNPEDTVELFKIRVRGKRLCTNKEPVQGLNTCHGGCESTTEQKFRGKRMRMVNTCSCCQPSKLEKLPVALTCDNGATFTKTFDNIVACQCLKCGGPEGQPNKEGGDDEEDED